MERLREGLKAKGHEVMEHDPNPFFFKFEKVAGEDWLGQKLDLTIWSDEISFVLWITTALDLVSFFVVAVLAVIIVGGIVNAMWMSVRERTKEIGTMRAIGAQKSFIVQLFVYESIMLGVLASLVGVFVGALMLFILNALELPITNDGARLFLMANTLKFNVHPGQILTTMVLFGCITGIAALYPALKAARLRPVEALMQTK
jgi:putative ABC transport system permease protein